MPAIFTPLRLDRVQQALFEVLAEATGVGVHWAYAEVPQESLAADFLALTMIGGPGPVNRKHVRGCVFQPPTLVPLTVGPLVVGSRVVVALNDFNYFHDVTGLDTVTTVRDDLVAQINDVDNIEPVTATAVGVDSLDLVPDLFGSLWNLKIAGPISAGALTLSPDFAELVDGTQTMLVNVQAYSKGREPRNGAWSVIQRSIAALQTGDLVERLRRFGVGVWDYTNPIDLSAITGAHWETRASFDVTLAARARWARPTDVVETVDVTLNTSQPTTTETITIVSP